MKRAERGLSSLRPEDIGSSVPRCGGRYGAAFWGSLLRLMGWRVVGELPSVERSVIILAPHTSNFDGLVGISAFKYLRLDIRFMIKHTLFRGPLGMFLRAVGGMPINRKAAGSVVHGAKARLGSGDAFWLGITPEGTRSGAAEWKTGFHRIAKDLNLPIIVVAFCYSRKEVQIRGTFHPGDDRQRDLKAIQALLDDVVPRHPERLSAPLKRRRD